MLKLLKKEVRLSMHPTAPIMLLLSTMVLIPNYPYSVIYFYVTLAVFFTCLQGRENNDVVYSLTLPIAKKDIVKARIAYSVILELLQMLLTIPFAVLSQKVNVPGNQASLDANIAYFGLGFFIYGIFNLIFFTCYYKNVSRVGISFVLSSVIVFLIVGVECVVTHAVPFIRDKIDTKDPKYLSYKLIVLGIGAILYVVFTGVAYLKSKQSFEKQDL